MIPPIYCGSKGVPGCTWAWTLLPNFFPLEWHVGLRLSILLHCASDSQSSISTWTFFFFSSGVMKTTVYLTSQCRDLIGISTLTHLKKKSWSPCEVHSSVPCFVSTRHLPHSSLLQKHWSLPCLCLLCI